MLYKIVWRGDASGLVEKAKYKREISCLEPFLEAAPQVYPSCQGFISSQVLTKTAILAQRKVAEDGLVVKLLDEGLRVSFMVSLVGTGRLLWLILFDQLFTKNVPGVKLNRCCYGQIS